MSGQDKNVGSLVIFERGARWPVHLLEPGACSPGRLVLAQTADESAPQFAARVGRKLGRLLRRGESPSCVTFVIADKAEGEVRWNARARIVQSLARLLQNGSDGAPARDGVRRVETTRSLWLSGGAGQDQNALEALVETVNSQMADGLRVAVLGDAAGTWPEVA